MRTIAVINHKGGCGKSTTAVNLAAVLGAAGRRTLVVDLDPQGTASSWLGAGPNEDRGLFDAFVGTRELADLAAPSRAAGVDLVPASTWLVAAERTLQMDLALGAIRALERMPDRWEVVLVDCPPALSYLGAAALCGCHEALVPTEAHELALVGIESVLGEMDRIRLRLNPTLHLTGIVVGRASRTNHARAVIDGLRARHGDAVFVATVRESIRVAEAAAAGRPIPAFAPGTPVADDVQAVAAELLARDPVRPGAIPIEPDEQAAGEPGWRRLMGRVVGVR